MKTYREKLELEKPKGKILNLGCGTSTYGTHRIDIAPSVSTTEVCNINFGLPYQNEFFNQVFAKNIFEHLNYTLDVLDECFRILKKGKELVVICDNPSYVLFHTESVKRQFQYYSENGDLHFQIYFPNNMVNLLERAGFKIKSVEFEKVYGKDMPRTYWFETILGSLSKKFFYSCFKIVAIKK